MNLFSFLEFCNDIQLWLFTLYSIFFKYFFLFSCGFFLFTWQTYAIISKASSSSNQVCKDIYHPSVGNGHTIVSCVTTWFECLIKFSQSSKSKSLESWMCETLFSRNQHHQIWNLNELKFTVLGSTKSSKLFYLSRVYCIKFQTKLVFIQSLSSSENLSIAVFTDVQNAGPPDINCWIHHVPLLV